MAYFEGKNLTAGYGGVDLPAPFGPSIATISPLFTSNEHELIISTPPYPAVRFLPSKYAINFSFLFQDSFQ